MPRWTALRARVRARPHGVAALGVGLVAAYLCLVNLDYAPLWHDEAPAVIIAKSLLERGDIVGWDGRNLVGGMDGRTLNDDLRDVLPPLMYAVNAAGLALFGVNETGARALHALTGLAALLVLFLILRQRLPRHPRLQLLIFSFAALSAQLLLYFRQSRYFAMMVFLSLLMFWLHGRYRERRDPWTLAALAAVSALAFLNHYTSGVAAMLALATYHVLCHRRDTARREWALFATFGALVALVGLGYLSWIGVLGGERAGFSGFAGQLTEEMTRVAAAGSFAASQGLKLWVYARELFAADWISWPIFLWLVAMLFLAARGKAVWPRRAEGDPGSPLPETARIILFGGLLALFSALLSPQSIKLHAIADLRYYVAALPLLLAMKGLFVEWLWLRHAALGAVALLALLLTSAGAWPFNLMSVITGERTLGWHLPMLVREIHRPYRDANATISDYLLRHAKKDDLVYVDSFADRETLTFYAGHHVLFSGVLSADTPLPESRTRRLRPTLFLDAILERPPDWVIRYYPHRSPSGRFEDLDLGRRIAYGPHDYEVVAKPNVFSYPTQRPELNMRSFAPLERNGVPYILRRVRE